VTHLSLFSGIGGLDLAAEWAGFQTVGQCEWADYPTKVLEKHWPDVPRWRDIRDLTADDFRRRTGRETVTCVSGGFPCQPHSLAGKRLASDDERDLWGELFRVYCETGARWLVAENVRGLLSSEDGRFFGRILRDLAGRGRHVFWHCFPASAVGAVFTRDRVAIVAGPSCDGLEGRVERLPKADTAYTIQRPPSEAVRAAIGLRHSKEPDTGGIREDDGVPHYVDRLKALGNCVAPPQFYPIFRAIADIEQAEPHNPHSGRVQAP